MVLPFLSALLQNDGDETNVVSGSDRDGACRAARHAFRLITQPLDEGTGVRVGPRRVEDYLIGIIAGATPVYDTGSGKDACCFTCQEMIFV